MMKYVVKCPKTGRHLREATLEERSAYDAQETKAPFDRPVRVGEVLVDTYTGPGLWHGGAGF